MRADDRPWQKLAAAFRAAPAAGAESAPFGFATRVAALAVAAPLVSPWDLFEKFAIRGLIAACAFSVAAVAFGYPAWAGTERDNDVPAEDAVAEVLDLT